VKVGDLIRLQRATANIWNLETGVVILLKKLPREDGLEYDWLVLDEQGVLIEFGRQIECSSELINECR
jgi:hypothetical protein